MRELAACRRRLRHLAIAVFYIVIVSSIPLQAGAAPKTDTIIFKNGDRLTGEVKSLRRGQLSFNTDATGTIAIEWDKISKIISNQHIQVETSSGTRYFGQLRAADEASSVKIETERGPQVLENARIITMSPIETGRPLSALDIDLTLGYNFAKAGGVTQGTFGVEMDYRTRQRIYSVVANTTTNDSNDQQQSTRSELELIYRRLWQNRWYVAGNLLFERNDELGLDLRRSLGVNVGRFQIQSNNMLLDLQAGLQFSRESLADVPEDTNSIEALLGAHWDWFRYDSPELDWSTSLQLIPNLSDLGRLRARFDTSLKWEIIKDLKWGVSFYSSFDNKAAEEASTSDYGVNTNVSYSF